MIHVLASIQVKPGQKASFLNFFKANIPNVLQEKGCVEYNPTFDIDAQIPRQVLSDNAVTIIEKWESLEDLKAHLQAPHMLAYRDQVKDLVEGSSLKVLTDA